MKTHSIYFGESARRAVRDNAERHPEAAVVVRESIAAARPWLEMTLDQVWGLMFAETLPRAWQVWSDGHCPTCLRSVPMYTWRADALSTPWKLSCPHCGDLFPKNDFHAFYRTGLDVRVASTPSWPTEPCYSTSNTPIQPTRCTASAWMMDTAAPTANTPGTSSPPT